MKGIKTYLLTGIIFVSIVGTVLHFAYQWSGNNVLVGLFTPVNESIWEHTKLLFFPMLLYSRYVNKKVNAQYPCISSAMISGALSGVLLIIVLFYTYSGIVGFHTPLVDISIFYISVITSFYIVYKTAVKCTENSYSTILKILQLALICFYIIFTFSPPDIPLFISPEL